jgi:uncharacterized protein YbaA (DUF1428 family)
MHYVDGYIVPVAKNNPEAYRRASKKMGKIWREYGALDLRECVADKSAANRSPGNRPEADQATRTSIAFAPIVAL